MARPLSWLPRLTSIRRTLAGSSRSHYERKELERLFELQPRAAQLLMDRLPTVTIGRSRLVERAALASLLEELEHSDNPSATLDSARARQAAPRRTLRELLPHDHPPADFESLPAALTLAPGELGIRFSRVEELVYALVELASLLDQHLDEFITRYQPASETAGAEPDEGVEQMFKDLEGLERKSRCR